GFESYLCWNPFGDHRIGGDAIKSSGPTTGNRGRLGDVSYQLAGHKVAHDRAVAATAIVNQSNGLRPFMHRYAVGDRLIAHRGEHGVTGAVGDITGAPLVGAAEGPLRNQPMSLVALGDGDFLTVDDHVAVAPGHPAPG